MSYVAQALGKCPPVSHETHTQKDGKEDEGGEEVRNFKNHCQLSCACVGYTGQHRAINLLPVSCFEYYF